MKLNSKILLGIAMLLLLQLSARGQTYERKHKEVKTFLVTPQTEIQLINKYGNVHVVNWEKDSVRFEIDVMVKGNKESKVQKNFDMIGFEFASTDYYVVGQTKFKSNKGAFWDEVSDLANTIFSGSNRAQINFKVYAPATCPIKIENKFGNVYLSNQIAPADISISNGDLKANSFSSELKLQVDFGDVSIREINTAEINAGYAELEIKKAQSLKVESKSSTLDLGLVDQLQIDSRRDKINIEELGIIKGDMSFSDLKVEYFTDLSMLNSTYGSMDFQSVSPAFKQLSVVAKFTDLDLNFESDVAFELDLQHSEKTDVALPKAIQDAVKKQEDEKEDLYNISGFMGQGSNLPLVAIKIEAGHIFITNF